MEILSDATFRGATRFKKYVTIEDGLSVWSNANLTNLLVPNGIESCSDIKMVGGARLVFTYNGGVALYCSSKPGNTELISNWSCLNSILSFAKLSTFTSPSIPANCTAFEFTGTAISDTNKTHLIQVQNTSTGKSVIAETWMTTNKKPAMSFAGCTSTIAAGTYTAMVV